MTVTELTKEMERHTGAILITRKELANCLGIKDPHGVDKYLHPLQPAVGKKYFIRDVAEEIVNRR